MIKIILLLIFFQCMRQQSLSLTKVSLQIDDNCWLIDSSMGTGNCQDEIYMVQLGLGSTQQNFNYQVDILREIIWFPLNQSYQNQSSTFKISDKKLFTSWNNYVVQGFLGSQLITIPSTNISTINAVAWVNQSWIFNSNNFDGLLGLSPNDVPNFFDSAFLVSQISTPVFSLQLGKEGQSSLLYYDQTPQKETVFTQVMSHSFWQVSVTNVKVQNYDFSYVASQRMIIDSTTSIIYINPQFHQKLFSKFFSDCTTPNGSMPICPCSNNFPKISFVFDTVQITMESSEYIKQNGDKCVLLIGQTTDDENPMIMGTSLMKGYRVTFDKTHKKVGFNGKAIGFAQSFLIIFQFVLVGLSLIQMGFGVYLLVKLKLQKKNDKQVVKQKLLQLVPSSSFLQN